MSLAGFALLLLFLAPSARAASASGEQIYRNQCVKCHGAKGTGVEDKYKDSLTGDWSVEKLTRYIAKTMPEDKPGSCTGDNAAKVAKYIHDAFYSRAAQARLRPARIELVHLTNRQYLNTVTDLLKQFGSAAAPVGTERGLKASYFPTRNMKREKDGKDGYERVDRQVNFDFGKGTPENIPAGTNGFSMQWRGSLIADETGDYELILKTPNGARLWVNDEDTAIVDAGVASDQLNEHKATLRLLGGRAYPLKLDWFKAPKDPAASLSLQWQPPHGAREPIPARNLATSRATTTFVLTTPFPPDDSSVGYERGVAVSRAWDEAATQAAIEVAGYVAKNLDRLSRSKPNDSARAAKVEAFGAEFVAAAFRRPLTAEQKQLCVALPLQGAPKLEDGVKRVVLLALKSPRFLYLGLDSAQPDDFTAAERLAFALWDSLPDRDLLKLAAQGQLHTRDQVTAQAQRMLAEPRTRMKVQGCFHQWLQLDRSESAPKDRTLFPDFTPELLADLRTSLNIFLDEVVWQDDSDYRQLLLADYLYVNHRLAKFYGLKTEAVDDFVKVTLDAKQRSGVVTHPYLLATFAYPTASSPIHRGVFLTRNIIGRALKPPPMAVVFKDADFAPNLTMREKITQLTQPKACQSCHSVINPLGFSLEQYDAVGRFRTQDNGRPVNATSDYTTDDGRPVHLSGARDVAEFAAANEQAHSAFIELLFHQLVKQPIAAYGPDALTRLRASFTASNFNVQKLLVEIGTISALQGLEKTSVLKKQL